MAIRLSPGDFLRGLIAPLRGYAILRRHPGLARYWVPPIVLTALALTASVLLSVRYHDDVVALVWSAPGTEDWAGKILTGLHVILRSLALLVGIGLGMLVCIALTNVIAAPFNDALSEVVEEIETGVPAPPFSLGRLLKDIGRTVRLELTKLSIYVAVMGPMLVASWVLPGVGQALYLVFGALFTVGYFALDYLDWPASRRGMRFKERLRLLRVRPLMALGFGCGVAVCLFVPLLNLFFMPLAVAGGTRLFLDLVEYQTHEL